MGKVHPLRRYRDTRKPKLSLGQLARKVKTSKTTLCEIEKGRRQVSLDLLPKLVRETGVPASELRPDLAAIMDDGGA